MAGEDQIPAAAASTITQAESGAARAADEPLETGARIDRYLVLGRVGAGAMGVVYAAYDAKLERKVALKLLRGYDAADEERLLSEARRLALLAHPNVVTVHDAGRAEARLFLAMEFVEGPTLRGFAKGRGWRDVVRVYAQAGHGLAAAHAAGLVHRDFKPDNVLVGSDGRARVADFGLARALTDATTGNATPSQLSQSRDTVVGTPGYMAPEQMRGEHSDPRSDQFSFCVALYEALYGSPAFVGATVRERAERILAGEVARPRSGSAPARLWSVVRRGLAPRREDRWPDMDALLVALERDPPARVRAVALGVLAAALIAAVPLSMSRIQKSELHRCLRADGRLDAAWNPGRRAALQRAFSTPGHADATAALASVLGALDGYVHQWSGVREQVCRAPSTATSGELRDLELQCLDRRVDELDTLTDVLARADAALVERGGQSVAGLSSIADCTAVTALRAPLAAPAKLRSAIEEVRTRLARSRAYRSAGQRLAAAPIAQSAADDAHRLGYAPVEAEALLERGMIDYRTTPVAGETSLRQALSAAEAGRHISVAVEAWSYLAFMLGVQEPHFDEALACLQHADSLLLGMGGDPRLEALLLRARGLVLSRQGKLDAAADQLQRALSLRERLLGADHPDVAELLDTLSTIENQRGHYEQALALGRRAQAIQERVHGARSLKVGQILVNQGSVLDHMNRLDEARATDEKALAILVEAEGQDNPDCAVALMNLANVYDETGQGELALAMDQRVVTTMTKAFGADSTQVAEALVNMGGALWRLGRKPEGLETFARALAIAEKAVGHDNLELYQFVYNYGGALRESDPKRAIPFLQRALTLRTKALGPAHPDTAATLAEVGAAYVDAKDMAHARPLLERALPLLSAAKSPALAAAQFSLAQALLTSEPAEAMRLAGTARTALAADPLQKESVHEIDVWLARH